MTGPVASHQLAHDLGGPRKVWLPELRRMAILAIPICLQQSAQQAFVLSSQAFFGTLGAEGLAGAAVGLTVRVNPTTSRLKFGEPGSNSEGLS